MTEIEKLKEEVAELRREADSAKYDLEVARHQLANIAITPGLYVIDVTGEYNDFKREIEADDYSDKLSKEGITSVVVKIISRRVGVEEEAFECPPRPSHDPQDVRNAA